MVIENDKYYWLEHSWEPYKGIHEYQTLNELLLDVKLKFEKSIEQENVQDYELAIFKYNKPNYNINCIEFIEHCEKGRKIL